MDNGRQFHEFAEIFPMITDAELKELSEDIKANGLREPITLFEQKILDGRNRYKACKMADVKAIMTTFPGSRVEALKYVESKNLHRRHLTPSQLAMAAAKLTEIDLKEYQPEDNKPEAISQSDNKPETAQQPSPSPSSQTKKTAKKPKGKTIQEAAKTMSTSPASVKKAKEILRKSPETAKRVESGEISLDKAQQKVRKEEGTLTDRETAQKKGRYAITILKAIPRNYKKLAFEMVRGWLNEEIEKLESDSNQ